jgi:hypothetical protein
MKSTNMISCWLMIYCLENVKYSYLYFWRWWFVVFAELVRISPWRMSRALLIAQEHRDHQHQEVLCSPTMAVSLYLQPNLHVFVDDKESTQQIARQLACMSVLWMLFQSTCSRRPWPNHVPDTLSICNYVKMQHRLVVRSVSNEILTYMCSCLATTTFF